MPARTTLRLDTRHDSRGGERPPMRLRAALAAAAVAIAPVATLAQAGPDATPLSQQTVISAPRTAVETPPRMDVETACPDLVEVLERELTAAIRARGKTGTMRVELSLRGREVADVVSRGGPHEYRQPVRRALRSLDCLPHPGGDRYVFNLRIDPEAADAATPRSLQAGDAPRRVARVTAP